MKSKIFTGASWIEVFISPAYPSKQEADQYRKDSDKSLDDRRDRRRLRLGIDGIRPWSIFFAIGLIALSTSQTMI